MDRRGTSEWRYKGIAINESARLLRSAIKAEAQLTMVPIPPSKAKTDPLYDDRIVQILAAACEGRASEYRELILQRESVMAAHMSDVRPTPDELAANYQINEAAAQPPPKTVLLLDDVLTTGCHFKASQRVLHERFPNANIFGIFIARRVPKSVDLEFTNIE